MDLGLGGGGRDVARGGRGQDSIIGGPKADRISVARAVTASYGASPGPATSSAVGRRRLLRIDVDRDGDDVVVGGPGHDIFFADPGDTRRSVEQSAGCIGD